MAVPSIELHDGVEIPQLGFGVFLVPPEDTQETVELALETGYRHIDTATAYRNERGVGAAIAASAIPRDEIFITTKLWNSHQGYDSTLEQFEKSTERLGTDHIDLYLIHWPVPTENRFVDTWRAFERIHEEGGTRTIGTSNFRIDDLERLDEETGTRPTINQVELHPEFQQRELREWQQERNIVTEAWGPLAHGGDILENDDLVAIGETHGKTPAQVVLRWHIQLGNVIFPKSVNAGRIRENFEIFDFELADDEMATIDAMDSGARIGPEPETFVAP